MNMGTIYFIEAVNEQKQSVAIKIGLTTNIKRRLNKMQADNPHQLRVIGSMRGDRGTEKRLHFQFAYLQLRGEWFRSHPALTTFAKTIT